MSRPDLADLHLGDSIGEHFDERVQQLRGPLPLILLGPMLERIKETIVEQVLVARRQQRRAAPGRVLIVSRIECAAGGLAGYALGIPAGTRIHVGVVEPAGMDFHQHFARPGFRRRPVGPRFQLLQPAMAGQDDGARVRISRTIG